MLTLFLARASAEILFHSGQVMLTKESHPGLGIMSLTKDKDRPSP